MLRFHCLPDTEDVHLRYNDILINAVLENDEWLL